MLYYRVSMTLEQKARLLVKIQNCDVYCRLGTKADNVGPGRCIGLMQLKGDAKNNNLHNGVTMTRENSRRYAEACVEMGCVFPEALRFLAESEDFPVEGDQAT